MTNKILLDGEWRLKIIENSVLKDRVCCTVQQAESLDAELIKGTVPGNFELDLFRAGKEGDPYIRDNIWNFYKYEKSHLIYYRKFDLCDPLEEYSLCFDGVDTFADVYLNGELVLVCNNMMLEYSVDVRGRLRKENELVVHIKPVVLEARKYPYTMRSMQNGVYDSAARSIRKAPHMFGWDILPRAISGGIYKSCYLKERKSAEILDVCYIPDIFDFKENSAKITFSYNLRIDEDDLELYKIEFRGICKDSTFFVQQSIKHTSGVLYQVPIKNCKFWYPKNYGEPDLYAVEVRLYRQDELKDTYSFNAGIKKVELIRTSVMDGETGDFRFRINDKDLFILGTNWTPLDIYHSKDKSRLSRALELLDETNCNMVRCWGGGLYEDHEFFDFCDAKGIMVWQDFAMGCGLYPNDEEFLRKIREEAVFIVKKLRNHASLCLWAGDNECDLFAIWMRSDPNTNKITRQILPDVISDYDYIIPYLPSSPYIDEMAYRTGKPLSETHVWGNRPWFKSDFYQNTKAAFESEIGYQASPAPSSLRKVLSEKALWYWEDKEASERYGVKTANREWAAHTPCEDEKWGEHSFILPLTDQHIRTLFKVNTEDLTLEDYCRMSQISQAEAFKFFIERMRIGKPKKTGIIWWNLLDGFPVHSNAVVDYYFVKKLAFHYIQRSQTPVCAIFGEPKEGKLGLYLVNDRQKSVSVAYKVTDVSSGKCYAEGKATVSENECICVEKLAAPEDQTFLLVEYTADGIPGKNHYMCNMPGIDYANYCNALKQCGLYEFEGFDC